MALRLRPDRKPRVRLDVTKWELALQQVDAGFERLGEKLQSAQKTETQESATCIRNCFWLYVAIVTAAVVAMFLL